jgi:membrane protein implicated in regulation of membrane protease activity
MSSSVEEAIYKLGADTGSYIAGMKGATAANENFAKSADATTVTIERQTKASRASEEGFARLQGRFDPAIRAHQSYQKVVEQVTRYEQAGIGTAVQRAAILEAASVQYNQLSRTAGLFRDALGGVSGQLIAMSAGAGPVGVLLSAFGPLGLAAAVGIGALGAAFRYVAEESARLGDKAIQVRAFSEATGLTTAQIGALRHEGAQLGIDGDRITMAFERLARQLNEARNAHGTLFEQIREADPVAANQLIRTKKEAEAIDVLARAWRGAADEGKKAALAAAMFGGRGGVALGPVVGGVADAGGIDAAAKSTKVLIEATDQQNKRWATMRAETVELEKQAKNILGSIFTEEGLQAAHKAAELMKGAAQAARDLAASKEGLSWWQRFFAEITKVSMAEGGMDPRSIDASLARTAARQRIAQGTGSNLAVNDKELASWQKLSDAAHGAGAAVQSVADKTKTAADQLKDATQDANLFNARMAALGDAATIDEQRQQRLKKIEEDRLKNQFSLVGSENDLLAARARSAANLDATMKTEALRLGHLGELASVEEIVAQKQNDINKAIREGAKFSDQEIAAMREKARIQAEQAKPENQIATERQMIFLSQEEGAIRQKLIGWGIDYNSVRGQALSQELRINDALKAINAEAGNFASSFAKDIIANGVTPMTALINAAKALESTLIDMAAKKLVSAALGSLFSGVTETAGSTAAQTTGATSAATILTTAGTTLAASMVAGATEAAGILGLSVPAAAAALPVAGGAAGTEVAVGGAAAAASLTAAAPIIGLAINGPVVALIAAIAAVASFLFFSSSSADKKSAQQAAQEARIKEAADDYNTRVSLSGRYLAATSDQNTLEGQLAVFEQKAQAELADEVQKGGRNTLQLQQTLEAEKLKIVTDFYQKQIDALNNARDAIAAYKDELYLSTLTVDQTVAVMAQRWADAAKKVSEGNADAISSIVEVSKAYIDALKTAIDALNTARAAIAAYKDELYLSTLTLDQTVAVMAQRWAEAAAKVSEGSTDAITSILAASKSYIDAIKAVIDALNNARAAIAAYRDELYLSTLTVDQTVAVMAQRWVDAAKKVDEGSTDTITSILAASKSFIDAIKAAIAERQKEIDSLKATGQAIADFIDQLALSQLTAEQTVAEMKRRAQASYEATLVVSGMGSADAITKAAKAAEDYIKALQDYIASVQSQIDALNASRTAIAAYRDELYLSTLTTAQVLEIMRKRFQETATKAAAGDADAISKIVEASKNYLAALNAQKSALEQTISELQGFKDSIQSFQNGLKTNSTLSPLNPQQRLDAARALYEETAKKAAAGDKTALGNLSSVSEAYLTLAKDFYASGTDYAKIFDEVNATLDATKTSLTDQISVAQKQLDAINKEIDNTQSIIDALDAAAAAAQTQIDLLNLLITITRSEIEKAVVSLELLQVAILVNSATLAKEISKLSEQMMTVIAVLTDAENVAAAEAAKLTDQMNAVIKVLTDAEAVAEKEAAKLTDQMNDVIAELSTAQSAAETQISLLQTQIDIEKAILNALLNGGSTTGAKYGGYIPHMADGGIVGNGIWNRDSVLASYAGGGNIMLAGGEYVTRATSVTPSTIGLLEHVNRTGSAPSANDNDKQTSGAIDNLTQVVARGFNGQTSELAGRLDAVIERLEKVERSISKPSDQRAAPGGKHGARSAA